MSSESFRMFLAALESDASLRQELRAAGFDAGMPPAAVVAFAARKGYAFTVESVSELTDQQLDAVAGGAGDLQLAVGRQSEALQSMSNIMKTMYDTSSGVIGNLRG